MKCNHLDYIDLNMLNVYSYQIKVGYLFSKHINVIGSCSYYILFRNTFKKLKITEKIKIIKDSKRDNENYLPQIAEYETFLKQLKQFKHPPTQVFQSFKIYENEFLKELDEWSETSSSFYVSSGLDGLFALTQKQDFICYSFRYIDEKSDFYINKMHVLKNMEPTHCKMEAVWLLPFVFYDAVMLPQQCATTLEDIKPDKPFFVKAFDLPNINLIHEPELTLLKNQIQTSMGDFFEDIDTWAKACYGGNATEIFVNNIQPQLSAVAEKINQNEILKHYDNLYLDKAIHYIYFGAASPLDVWEYYEMGGVITKEEKQILIEEYNNQQPYFIPIMLFSNYDNLNNKPSIFDNTATEEVIENVQSIKKHISLDDE